MEAKDIFEKAIQDPIAAKAVLTLSMEKDKAEALMTLIVKICETVLQIKVQKDALKTQPKKPSKPVVCFRCQETGHVARECHGQLKCKYCAQAHFTRECPQKICKTCKKRHPKNQCKKVNKWCKWCRVWNKHSTEECQNANILKRLAKLENIRPIPRTRPGSKSRRVRGPPLMTRGRGRGRGFKPGPRGRLGMPGNAPMNLEG